MKDEISTSALHRHLFEELERKKRCAIWDLLAQTIILT